MDERRFHPVLSRAHPNLGAGTQYIYAFTDSVYGASVVSTPGSDGYEDGLYELAVLKFERAYRPFSPLPSFHLDYTTSITNDVLGCLTDDDVQRVLAKIERL